MARGNPIPRREALLAGAACVLAVSTAWLQAVFPTRPVLRGTPPRGTWPCRRGAGLGLPLVVG